MDWIPTALDFLSDCVGPGYAPGTAAATEPTALAALALTAHGRALDADKQLRALQSWQTTDGSLGVTEKEPHPQWPTTLAVIAWTKASTNPALFQTSIGDAVNWLLQQQGETIPPRADNIGHDTMLVGWPWVQGTHSWLEPTAFALLALKAAGKSDHPRAREAAKLLADRLLPEGGCNYGNTFILGQQLRPHVQPTGLVMLALADEHIDDDRVAASLEFLNRELPKQRSAASYAYAAMGLAAHRHAQTQADESQLDELATRALEEEAPLRLALLLLAVSGANNPLYPSCVPSGGKQKATEQ